MNGGGAMAVPALALRVRCLRRRLQAVQTTSFFQNDIAAGLAFGSQNSAGKRLTAS
jgi:hypothetical protein